MLDRYSRQTLFGPIGKEGQERLRAATVTIVGCGALGTVLANNLCRAGIGRLRNHADAPRASARRGERRVRSCSFGSFKAQPGVMAHATARYLASAEPQLDQANLDGRASRLSCRRRRSGRGQGCSDGLLCLNRAWGFRACGFFGMAHA